MKPDFRPFFENLRKRMECYIRDTVCIRGLITKISKLFCPSIDLA